MRNERVQTFKSQPLTKAMNDCSDDDTLVNQEPIPVRFITFVIMFAVLWGLAGMYLPHYFLEPKLDQHIFAKAKRFPDVASPRLNFFLVPYSNEAHMVSHFNTNLGSCLGLSSFRLS